MDDLNDLQSGIELSADLCIVGSGPVGLAIAREFFGTSTSVLILDSGTEQLSQSAERLDAIESVGAKRELQQDLVRNRAFGGSANTWQGKCAPFSQIDYQLREWIAHSGWPITVEDMKDAVDRASELLQLGPAVYDERAYELLGHAVPEPRFDAALLQTVFWQYAKSRSFPFAPLRIGSPFMKRKTDNIKVLLNATVTQLHTDSTGRKLDCLEVSSFEGQKCRVVAKATVLCCGGIENARLMLASRGVRAEGVGNEHGMVGRFLMDHLRCEVAHFSPEVEPVLAERFDFYYLHTPNGDRAYLPGFTLSPEVQQREQLSNCAAWVERPRAQDDPWDGIRAVVSRSSKNPRADMKAVLVNVGLLPRGLHRRLVTRRGLKRKVQAASLICMVEQIPDPESRISLSTRTDAYGVPLARVDWRVHDLELKTLVRMAELVISECERVGLPAPRLADWAREGRLHDAPVIDIAHPTGTTRMSSDPTHGVVDENCKVHDVEGLYVAGTSVFPTSGHANPTLMAAALSIRLADHLKLRLSQRLQPIVRHTGDVLPPAAAAPTTRRRRVLVTGGSGRIGRPLLQALVQRGDDVVVITSHDRKPEPGFVWQHMDWSRDLDFARHVEGCDAVVHLAAELSDIPKMNRVNGEATLALARAAEQAGVRSFVYASSVTVYGSPQQRTVTEDLPLFSNDQDYLAEPYMRAYARTKLEGERHLHETARQTSYVILRPSVVCDASTILSLRDWRIPLRVRAAGRYTNHVSIDDVTAAFLWALDRGLTGQDLAGKVDVFNLSDVDPACDTFAKLYQKAFKLTQDRRFLCPVFVPREFDLLKDTVRYRAQIVRPRYPLGMLNFDSSKLEASGFERPCGIGSFYDRTLRMFNGLT